MTSHPFMPPLVAQRSSSISMTTRVAGGFPRPLCIVLRRSRFGSFSAEGATFGPVARLGFLGPSPIGRESPRLWAWKSLDFLGFSRPNQAFSMGCTGFSLREISLALFARGGVSAGTGASLLWHAEAQKSSWEESNSFCDFLREIVVDSVGSRRYVRFR
jgi:hypothetical protein